MLFRSSPCGPSSASWPTNGVEAFGSCRWTSLFLLPHDGKAPRSGALSLPKQTLSVRTSEPLPGAAAAPDLALCTSPGTPESAMRPSATGIGWQDVSVSNPSFFLPHAEMFAMQHNLRPVERRVKMSARTRHSRTENFSQVFDFSVN